MPPPAGPVIAVVPDLFFATRIAATAKAASVELELVPPTGTAARLAKGGVSLVLLDLHAPGAVALIGSCKRVAPGTPLVGFYSHVERALAEDALAAGADAALPRSRFVAKLAALLAQGVSALEPRAPGVRPESGEAPVEGRPGSGSGCA